MEKTRYFYDSCAVMAYLSDNPNYRGSFEENDGVLTKLNLVDIRYRTIELHGEEAASQVVELFAKYTIDFASRDIVESMKLRLALKKEGRNISYSYALGYYLALKNKLKFLTGDKEFEGLDGVEFVKCPLKARQSSKLKVKGSHLSGLGYIVLGGFVFFYC